MAAIAIPVLLSFFLGPGMGQLYNKQYKKAILLIVVSAVVLIAAGVWYYKALTPFIPTDLTNVDPHAMQELMRNAAAQLSPQVSHTILFAEAILTVLWIYGVVDAYLVAQKKRRMTTT